MTRAEAARELLERKAARERVLDFTCYTHPRYVPGRHHAVVAEKLDKVLTGEIDRLLICAPPRHGKSELSTVRMPALAIGKRPELQVMSFSYSDRLAYRFSSQTRNTVNSPEYQRLFPGVELAADSKAKELWRTSAGGEFFSGPVSTGSGFGADLLLIDDPIKSWREANSAAYRDALWDWWTSTAYTRLMGALNPNGAIVVTMTLWHELDFGMTLLSEMDNGGDQYVVVRLPALIEDAEQAKADPLGRKIGEALWPERFPAERLERLKRATSARVWSALYQQAPTTEEGDYFKREWFEYYSERPNGLRYYLASDFAVSEKETADFTVHQIWGVDKDSRLYLVDMSREQVASDKGIHSALDLIAQYQPVAWIGEKGQIERALEPLIVRMMQERRVYCRRVSYARTTDKQQFASAFQGRMSGGFVKLPAKAAWLPALRSEWLSFPSGAHDDTVDAAAILGHHLHELHPPIMHQGGKAKTGLPRR